MSKNLANDKLEGLGMKNYLSTDYFSLLRSFLNQAEDDYFNGKSEEALRLVSVVQGGMTNLQKELNKLVTA